MNLPHNHKFAMDLDLEAMLYVLRDPLIDCDAFENRMTEDAVVSEAVARAVELVCNVRELKTQERVERVVDESIRIAVTADNDSSATPSRIVTVPKMVFDPTWAFLVTISAVASVFLLRSNFSSNDSPTEPMLQVAYAWTDIQSSRVDSADELSMGLGTGGEDSVASAESRGAETEIPDWMVLAAIASNSVNAEMMH